MNTAPFLGFAFFLSPQDLLARLSIMDCLNRGNEHTLHEHCVFCRHAIPKMILHAVSYSGRTREGFYALISPLCTFAVSLVMVGSG